MRPSDTSVDQGQCRRRRRGAVVAARLLGALWSGVAVVFLAAVFGVAVLAVGFPKLAGAVPVTVLSNSMAPIMPVGSLAVVTPTMPLSTDVESLSVEEIEQVNDVTGIEPGM